MAAPKVSSIRSLGSPHQPNLEFSSIDGVPSSRTKRSAVPDLMTRKLLVVFDGPHVTAAAVTAAVAAFNDGPLCLTLLAVVAEPSHAAQSVYPGQALRTDAIAEGNKWVRSGLDELPTSVEARSRILVGKVPDVVRSVLAETPYDAVVLCPRKRGRLRSRLLANPISRLSQNCGVPLVCLPSAD